MSVISSISHFPLVVARTLDTCCDGYYLYEGEVTSCDANRGVDFKKETGREKRQLRAATSCKTERRDTKKKEREEKERKRDIFTRGLCVRRVKWKREKRGKKDLRRGKWVANAYRVARLGCYSRSSPTRLQVNRVYRDTLCVCAYHFRVFSTFIPRMREVQSDQTDRNEHAEDRRKIVSRDSSRSFLRVAPS